MTQIRGNRPRKDDVRGESTGRHAQERGRDMRTRSARSREGSSPVSSRAASRATRARGSSSRTEDPASGNRRARRSDAPSTSRDSGVRSGAGSTGRPRSASAQRRAGKGSTASGGGFAPDAGASAVERVVGLIAAAIVALLRGIASAIAFVARAVASLCRRGRAFSICLALVLVAGVGVGVDAVLNGSTMRAGVSIGEVDVSGMTRDEAIDAVDAHYQERIASGTVIVFSDEETAASVDLDAQLAQADAIAEQISFEEAQKSKKLWRVDASTLGASLPTERLADEAFAVGRGLSGVYDRIGAALGGKTVPVELAFDETLLENLAHDVDQAIGVVRVDFDVSIDDGVASVVEGHDGNMVDRDAFSENLSACLLAADPADASFVAVAEYAPVRVDFAGAQKTCDVINAALRSGASFTHDGSTVAVDGKELGGWIATEVRNLGDGHILAPVIDDEAATPALVSSVNAHERGSEVVVSISVSDDVVTVEPQGEVTVPELGVALDVLDENLFGGYRSSGSADAAIVSDPIDIATQQISGPIDFDAALSYGIVSEISSYTTQFVGSSATKNRTHNIHLVSDLINNSVADANGGLWSFNDVAGNCNEDAGFLPAGAITGDEYIEEAGGGICQVATTVFNAVYDAGYAVPSRTNHSLYVASYPAGRDAAVSYPDLDFVWRNDTASDVLLRATYTDSSITVTLYGVDPGFIVSSETGDWVEGEKHATKTIVDDTLTPGTSYPKTAGTDGMEITVVRTVKSKDGSVIRKDAFASTYSPVTEVIIKGPDAEDAGADGKDAAAA